MKGRLTSSDRAVEGTSHETGWETLVYTSKPNVVQNKSSIPNREKEKVLHTLNNATVRPSRSSSGRFTSLHHEITGLITLIFEFTLTWSLELGHLFFQINKLEKSQMKRDSWHYKILCVGKQKEVTSTVLYIIMSLFVCKQTLKRASARFSIIGINMIDFFCSHG